MKKFLIAMTIVLGGLMAAPVQAAGLGALGDILLDGLALNRLANRRAFVQRQVIVNGGFLRGALVTDGFGNVVTDRFGRAIRVDRFGRAFVVDNFGRARLVNLGVQRVIVRNRSLRFAEVPGLRIQRSAIVRDRFGRAVRVQRNFVRGNVRGNVRRNVNVDVNRRRGVNVDVNVQKNVQQQKVQRQKVQQQKVQRNVNRVKTANQK